MLRRSVFEASQSGDQVTFESSLKQLPEVNLRLQGQVENDLECRLIAVFTARTPGGAVFLGRASQIVGKSCHVKKVQMTCCPLISSTEAPQLCFCSFLSAAGQEECVYATRPECYIVPLLVDALRDMEALALRGIVSSSITRSTPHTFPRIL